MAKFKPGEPKKGGRTKGTPNRTTDEVRIALLKLLNDNLENLQTDFKALKGKERASLLISLAKHCTPPALNPATLTEDQLLQIVKYLKDEQTRNKTAN